MMKGMIAVRFSFLYSLSYVFLYLLAHCCRIGDNGSDGGIGGDIGAVSVQVIILVGVGVGS